MKNEYDVAVGQVKALESEVLHAKGSEPCVYLVRLEAEGLTDGSAVLNVAVYLKNGGRTLRTWNWYTPETASRAIYRRLVNDLGSRSLAAVIQDGTVETPDMVEDYGSLDVSEALGLMRDAYQRGLGTARDAKDAEVEKTLQDISDRSADIAYRHREERRAAFLDGNDKGRYEGVQSALQTIGFTLRIETDPMSPADYVWTLYQGKAYVTTVGSFLSEEEAMTDAVAKASKAALRAITEKHQAREKDLEDTREATAKAYLRVNADNADLRKRLQAQTRLAAEAMDARDRLEGKVTRLEGELEDAKVYAEDLVGSAKARERREALTGGQLVRTNIKVTKQVNLKDVVDLEGDSTWVAYVGLDHNARPIAIVPMCNTSVALRAAIGDVWVEVK